MVSFFSAEDFQLGLDVSGLTTEQIEFFLPPSGGAEILFAKSVAPIELYEGVYLWSAADSRLMDLFNLLSSHAVSEGRVIVEESYTPRCLIGWYTENGYSASNRRGTNDNWYGNKMSAMVYRWKPGGVVPFSGGNGVSEWGLWNEPDGEGIMRHPDEDDDLGLYAYCDMGMIAAQMVRDADPQATIISGGFLHAASPRPPVQGSFGIWARRMFGRTTDNPATFLWEAAPDVLHWHPYDSMEYDTGASANEETHYDPLVIDTDDLMCQVRPDELPPLLECCFEGGYEPNWDSMPQYVLEYVPTYSLEWWRSYQNPSGINNFENEYYTKWRANFQLTTTLCLLESERVTVLAPAVPQSHWWVEDWNSFGLWNVDTPNQTGTGYTWADEAWRELTLKLRSRTYINSFSKQIQTATTAPLNVSFSYSNTDSPLVRRWLFSSTPEQGRLHVLRTYRAHPEDEFEEDIYYNTDVPVDNSTVFVAVTDIYGLNQVNVYPVNGYATISVNGYIEYVEEHTLQPEFPEEESFDISAALFSDVISVAFSHDAISVKCSPEVSLITLFDLSGRCVNSIRTNQFDNSYSFQVANLPNAMYTVIASNDAGIILSASKVVIAK
jgi:hypothetical protein